jgi:hypothetical protein
MPSGLKMFASAKARSDCPLTRFTMAASKV